jgi:hypothetical protein
MKAAAVETAWNSGRAAGERKVRYGLKLAVGLALLAWLVRHEGWHRIATCLARVSPGWFAWMVTTYLIGQSLCAWKWSLLAEGLGFRQRLRFYWVHYLGAMFCSLFLPTQVGGDVYRALVLARPGKPFNFGFRISDFGLKRRSRKPFQSEIENRKFEIDASPDSRVSALVSVLADRGTGVLAMVWIAVLAAGMPPVHLPPWAVMGLDLLCAVLTAGFVIPFFFRPRFARSGFLGRVMVCWDRPGQLLIALGAAFLFQGLIAVIYVLIGRALGLGIDARFYFVLCPLVSLAATAPVSINGLGVREASLMALFPLVGVGADQAIAFGLAWSATVTLADLLGGLVLFCVEAEEPGVQGEAVLGAEVPTQGAPGYPAGKQEPSTQHSALSPQHPERLNARTPGKR